MSGYPTISDCRSVVLVRPASYPDINPEPEYIAELTGDETMVDLFSVAEALFWPEVQVIAECYLGSGYLASTHGSMAFEAVWDDHEAQFEKRLLALLMKKTMKHGTVNKWLNAVDNPESVPVRRKRWPRRRHTGWKRAELDREFGG